MGTLQANLGHNFADSVMEHYGADAEEILTVYREELGKGRIKPFPQKAEGDYPLIFFAYVQDQGHWIVGFNSDHTIQQGEITSLAGRDLRLMGILQVALNNSDIS